MACPVCDHTMQNLGVPGTRKFWCPRCGTLKEEGSDGYVEVETTGWVRHMIASCKLSAPSINRSQHSTVKAFFVVDQYDMGQAKLKLERIEE